MNQQTLLQRLETLGYYTLPHPHPESPGYSGLLVVLRQAPHGHEPERIELRLHEWDGKTTMVHLHAEVNRPLSHVVCPGRIMIRSPHEREANFFIFGGTLESEALSDETVFSLRSAAPVLEMLPERETIANLMADETEGLFARAEAQQQLSSQQLLDRLVRQGRKLCTWPSCSHCCQRMRKRPFPITSATTSSKCSPTSGTGTKRQDDGP